MSFGKSESESKPLTPHQVQQYWNTIDANTGGRLGGWAAEGTQATEYQKLTPEQILAVGGLGATQTAEVERMRQQGRQEVAADPSLSMFQRQRTNQLADQDVQARLNAIAKETEAAVSGLAGQENKLAYQADVANQQLTRDDLLALANIFFGGKGNTSNSQSINLGF